MREGGERREKRVDKQTSVRFNSNVSITYSLWMTYLVMIY